MARRYGHHWHPTFRYSSIYDQIARKSSIDGTIYGGGPHGGRSKAKYEQDLFLAKLAWEEEQLRPNDASNDISPKARRSRHSAIYHLFRWLVRLEFLGRNF